MFSNLEQAPTTDLTTKPYTEVTVDALGRAVIEGKNFQGSACTLIGQALQRAIRGPGDSTTPKPEFFQSGQNTQDATRW